MNRIYLDNAATTCMDERVLDSMLPFLKKKYGNPSGIYATGREARKAVEHARQQAAAALNCKPNEIYFTSGGTESDNWACRCGAQAGLKRGREIITTEIEHPAVLECFKHLAFEGFETVLLPVNLFGVVELESFEDAISENTGFVSIMMANNEIGTLQPVQELVSIARQHGILFHTDAVQAFGSIPINLQVLEVDLLSLSAHKFHGPKGIGLLYISEKTKIDRFHLGGQQERGWRAGTENVAGIVGMGMAMQLASESLEKHSTQITKLRDLLIEQVMQTIPGVRLNGHPTQRLANNAHFVFDGVSSSLLLALLDQNGIAASAGSACTAGTTVPSHVLKAIGYSDEQAANGIRLTLSYDTTKEQVKEVVETLAHLVNHIRRYYDSAN